MPITLNGSSGGLGLLNSMTSVTTTSGTSFDYTGIPAGVKRITVMFSGLSTVGGSGVQVQLGSGSIQTTGYVSAAALATSGATGASSSTTGLLISTAASAGDFLSGSLQIMNITGFNWISSGSNMLSNAAYAGGAGGAVTLSGTLDRIRITTINGTTAFDAGSINILYE